MDATSGLAKTSSLPIAEKEGVEIYDVEYVKEGSDFYLRAYIDKQGGVDINDCERVSKHPASQKPVLSFPFPLPLLS